jgi:hypothetical protein
VSSPSADQSSWGMVKLTIRGVSARCGGIKGHRIDDPVVSPVGKDGPPGSVLDQTAEVTYDSLP